MIAIAASFLVARGRRLQVGVLIAVIVAIGAFWFSASSLDRFKNFESGTGRVDLWQVAWRMAEDNPVTGAGINNFRSESANYVLQPGRLESTDLIVDTPHVVHNVYLQQLAETGVIGFALLVAVLVTALRASWTASRQFDELGDSRFANLARAVLVGQIGSLTASVFISNGYDRRLWLLLALGPMLAAVAHRAGEARRA